MAPKKTPTKTRKKKGNVSAATNSYTLHLIVGATGDLLYRLATVAATQFSSVEFELVSHPMNDTLPKVQKTLEAIAGPHTVVIHALPDPMAKQLVRNTCVQRRIPNFDATGPLLDFLADCVGALPDNDLSLLHRFDAAYEKRIEAMEFALSHDDGLGIATLRDADIVIVGLSRVSKSPTTLYLSSRGFKVANVSVTPLTGFPAELSRVAKRKIVALTTQPKRLQQIRAERRRAAGMESSNYDDLPSVIREVMAAESEYRARGYPMIDVTDLTIEQTAVQILELLKLSPT